jgi:diguanylate cyclase (GGDEF)-like protein/PAS domain S-box-containing protein
LPPLVTIWDQQQRNLDLGDAAGSWFGVSPQEARGRGLRDVLGAALPSGWATLVRAALDGETRIISTDLTTASGQSQPATVTAAPYRLGNRLCGFFLVFTAPDGIVIVGASGRIELVNRQTEQLFGYARDELIGQPIEILVPQRHQHQHLGKRDAFLGQASVRAMGAGSELSGRRRDGSEFPVEISLSPLHTDQGLLVSAAVRDITERRLSEEALRQSEERFRLTVDTSPLGMALVDVQGAWLGVNEALCRITGYVREELLGMKLQDIVHPDDLPADVALSGELLAGSREFYQLEKRYIRADGCMIWVRLTRSLVRDALGHPLHFVSQVEDITERLNYEQELQKLAVTDPLTGLPNRTLLLDRTGQALMRLGRHGGCVGLLLLDIDRFKQVNDTLGHPSGDVLLVEVGRRLAGIARAEDTFGRLGGDEFALLVPDVRDAQGALEMAGRLLRALGETVFLETSPGHHELVQLSASIGVAISSETSMSATELYRDADLALYKAKDDGRSRAALFDASLHDAVATRVLQESQLRRALAEGRITTVRQAIVGLPSGEVVGYEVLARLVDPDTGNLMSPSDFLPIATDVGLMPDIDLVVLEQTLSSLPTTPGLAHVHINVSAATLADPRWARRLNRALDESRASAADLYVELTEQVLMTASSHAAGSLLDLRERGVKVGLDDFGTGYSALSYLQNLSIDFLKLDRSLVLGIGCDTRTDTLARGLIEIAHGLGLHVIAEGVEHHDQLESLKALQCDGAQGFYLGRPLLFPMPRLPARPVFVDSADRSRVDRTGVDRPGG